MTPDRDAVSGHVERLVALADVVKASDEDLAWLYPDDTLDVAAERWLAAGASVVVVTRGRDGSLAWARSGPIETHPPPTIDVVDTVGAGDAYMSGLIVALHREGLLDVWARTRLRDIEASHGAALDRPRVQVRGNRGRSRRGGTTLARRAARLIPEAARAGSSGRSLNECPRLGTHDAAT